MCGAVSSVFVVVVAAHVGCLFTLGPYTTIAIGCGLGDTFSTSCLRHKILVWLMSCHCGSALMLGGVIGFRVPQA